MASAQHLTQAHQPASYHLYCLHIHQERKQLRERLGITSPADFGRLLQLLPRELIDCLRVTSVVRGIAASLGGTIHDRLRINATYALKVRMPTHAFCWICESVTAASYGSAVPSWREQMGGAAWFAHVQ